MMTLGSRHNGEGAGTGQSPGPEGLGRRRMIEQLAATDIVHERRRFEPGELRRAQYAACRRRDMRRPPDPAETEQAEALPVQLEGGRGVALRAPFGAALSVQEF